MMMNRFKLLAILLYLIFVLFIRLLEKYGALLVHPSADVRYFAISTVNGVCESVGFPDGEVFVVPILRPFLRYQPSPRHLTTIDGLESCLHPPWAREKFQEELDKLLTANASALSPISGQWTSISFQVDEGENRSKAKSSFDKVDETQQTIASNEKKVDSQTEQVCAYLKMLARSRTYLMKGVSSSMKVKPQLDNVIEGSLKLAQQIKFPRQDNPRISTTTLPSWYITLRNTHEAQGHGSSETAAIRSVKALGQVYGLSIMEDESAANNASKSSDMTADRARDILQSDESRMIDAACSGQWGSEVRNDCFTFVYLRYTG